MGDDDRMRQGWPNITGEKRDGHRDEPAPDSPPSTPSDPADDRRERDSERNR